jgi:hypothetical protein
MTALDLERCTGLARLHRPTWRVLAAYLEDLHKFLFRHRFNI